MKIKRTTWDAIIFSVFAILIIIGLRSIFPNTEEDPETINQKHAIAELGYCNASDAKPCVVSFSLDAQNNMLISLIIPRPTYPEFYLTITGTYAANHYECTRLKDLPTNILCTGPQMNLGEPLTFALFALDDDRLLANGNFTIIGLMLATPVIETAAAATETNALTPVAIDLFPVITTPTIRPTATPTVPSYPNLTSYPNPSYP